MKKKILGVLLAASMVASLCGGCGSDETGGTTPEPATTDTSVTPEAQPADTEVTPEPAAVEAEAIPDPVYYFSFDEADGTDGIVPTKQTIGGDPILDVADKEVKFMPGVKGDAIYTDGVTGYKLSNVNGVGDNYTVSFWMYATRFANYMPTVQFGPDVHGDATGGQKYLNITRSEWNADGPSFPCIWSYDELNDAIWPAWAPEEADEHLKQWMNITLVVDSSKVSDDGIYYLADLYVNGELFGTGINVVPGAMSASDNFDFLIGINYWDAVFKGAFDELYIFDSALTEGQVKTLFAEGDVNAAYEEPERIIEVVQSEDALCQIGNPDYSNGFWSDWSEAYEIKDGETKEVVLKNFSDGAALYNNYVTVFTNEYSEAHTDPNTASDTHTEWAAVRADCYGWTPDGTLDGTEGNSEYTWSWGNWDTWRTSVMVDADVTLLINRSGDTLTIDASIVDFNGTVNTSKSVVKTKLTAEDPCFFLFTNEACYNEVVSVGDAIIVEPNPDAIITLGNTDYTNAWWTDWTEGIELNDGDTKTVKFTNYSDGKNNWDNYVVVFTNEYSEAHADPNTASDAHVEWGAVRADAYGWGTDYAATYETSWGDDWSVFTKAMLDADVTATITRNGGEIVIDAEIVDRNGDVHTNKTTFTSALTAADPCFFLITCEECFLEVLSVE